MWPYWILFFLPALAALREQGWNGTATRTRWTIPSVLAVIGITLLIGYRHGVGGDWAAYIKQFEELHGLPFTEALATTDAGYAALNWICDSLGWDIYAVNLFCGFIFAVGLLRFCLSMPRPWLALTIAVPYMVVVVAMGYSRQAVALGFTMLGLVALKNRATLWFVIWGLLGATFHKTAVLVLPIAILAASRNRLWSLVLGTLTTVIGYQWFLQDSFEEMYANYVGADVQSEGALIRLFMNAVPSMILLLWGRRFAFSPSERSLWRWFAGISLALLAALFAVSSASTAIDRMALYLLPIQIAVFSHLPSLAKDRGQRNLLAVGVVVYYAAVLFTWLNYANYATYWIPYRFYPLETL